MKICCMTLDLWLQFPNLENVGWAKWFLAVLELLRSIIRGETVNSSVES